MDENQPAFPLLFYLFLGLCLTNGDVKKSSLIPLSTWAWDLLFSEAKEGERLLEKRDGRDEKHFRWNFRGLCKREKLETFSSGNFRWFLSENLKLEMLFVDVTVLLNYIHVKSGNSKPGNRNQLLLSLCNCFSHLLGIQKSADENSWLTLKAGETFSLNSQR